jgi:hypothetical protein
MHLLKGRRLRAAAGRTHLGWLLLLLLLLLLLVLVRHSRSPGRLLLLLLLCIILVLLLVSCLGCCCWHWFGSFSSCLQRHPAAGSKWKTMQKRV